MTIAEWLREEGRKATLRSQLLYKFQALDAEAEARLQAATPEALDRYLRRVLTADSLAAVFKAEGRARTQRRSARGTGQSGASSSRPRRRVR